MNPSRRNLSPAEASERLGVSPKALRLYEERGLITPDRSAAGWRVYRPQDLERAADVVSLRALGLNLTQIGRVLSGAPGDVEQALVAHEVHLEARSVQIRDALIRVRRLRENLRDGRAPGGVGAHELAGRPALSVKFTLPWPWNGEWFEFHGVPPLNFITGPLGSGKTRFAMRLAEAAPDGRFIGLDRQTGPSAAHASREPGRLAERVESMLAWMQEDGAERTDALVALVAAMLSHRSAPLVVDLVEDKLNDDTQRALVAYLRLHPEPDCPLFLMTRSSSILDLELVGANEAIIYCPANHDVPFRASHRPGCRGYEALTTCLASPDVRARTEGVIAMRPRAQA